MLSKKQIARRLLTRGFLPTELPPIFRVSRAIVAALDYATKPLSKSRFISRPSPYSLARAGTKRRHLTIPNIINYYDLVQLIGSNWRCINTHYQTSAISLSTPEFTVDATRAISFTPLNDLKRHRLLHSAGYRYILRTDVSAFYPSVYTHTIAWALHGKREAKKRRKAALLGDRIDQSVRDGQDRQSVGIPIGPDTSHIISAMIAVAVDKIILSSLKGPYSGFRYMDDYCFCFDDQAAAATALTVLTHALRDFELNINETKTRIQAIDEQSEYQWAEEIENSEFSESGPKQARDIELFFDKAMQMARQLGDDNIVKYALRRTTRQVVAEENWRLYEAYLAYISVSYPSSLPTICEILSTYRKIAYKLSVQLWEKIATDTVKTHAPLRHDSEVCWAIWLLREIGAMVHDSAKQEIERVNNGLVATMALFLQDKSQFRSKVDTRYWEETAGTHPFQGELWLLAYEGSRRGWLSMKMAELDEFGVAERLGRRGVSFLNERAEMEPIFTKVSRVRIRAHGKQEEPLDLEIEGYDYEFASKYEMYG